MFEKLIPLYENKFKTTNPIKEIKSISGEKLINMNMKEFPTLLKPIFPKIGLIALAGSSDTGKSTFLRQFAIHVASGMDNFLGFNINVKHKSAVLLSTEDDEFAISYLLNKQNKKLNFPAEAFKPLSPLHITVCNCDGFRHRFFLVFTLLFYWEFLVNNDKTKLTFRI